MITRSRARAASNVAGRVLRYGRQAAQYYGRRWVDSFRRRRGQLTMRGMQGQHLGVIPIARGLFGGNAFVDPSNRGQRAKRARPTEPKMNQKVAQRKIVADKTGPGKSAGFLTTGPSLKGKGTKWGINFSGEFGGKWSDRHLAIVGHATHPYANTMRIVWATAIKKLLREADINVTSLTSPYLPFQNAGATGDVFRVTYQYNQTQTFANDDLILGASDSILDIVNWANDITRPWNDMFGPGFVQPTVWFIQYIPITGTVGADNVALMGARFAQVKMLDLQVTVRSKSSLKIQNRSVVTSGDTEDAVNNVPLYGKSFEGNGTGVEWIGTEKAPLKNFYADQFTGVIVKNSTTTSGNNQLHEVPEVSELKSVQRMGKAKIDPGEIKTSVLTDVETHYFQTWLDKLNSSRNSISSANRYEFGKYRLFFIEKMLDPDASYDITTAFEHQLNLAGKCLTYTKDPTLQFIDEVRDITPGS